MIDKLAGNQYKHDEVFNLDAKFAYSLMLSRYERDCYQDRAERIKQNLQQ